MAMSSGPILRDPVFRVGLLLRVALVIWLVPQIQYAQFVPFLREAITHPTLDPWSHFLFSGGNPVTYQYTDPGTGCANSDGALVTVQPLPTADFTNAPVACASKRNLAHARGRRSWSG